LPGLGILLAVVMVRSSRRTGRQKRPVAIEPTPSHIAMKFIDTSAMKKT
jgi:hypothetical protein